MDVVQRDEGAVVQNINEQVLNIQTSDYRKNKSTRNSPLKQENDEEVQMIIRRMRSMTENGQEITADIINQLEDKISRQSNSI